MMFDNLSKGCRKLIEQAQDLALQMGHSEIHSGHLLLAMLENPAEDDGNEVGERMFAYYKISPADVRYRLLNTLEREEFPKKGQLSFSRGALRMIFAAAEIRAASRSNLLYSKHLILGAVKDDKCFAGKFLSSKGLTWDKAREFVSFNGVRPIKTPWQSGARNARR